MNCGAGHEAAGLVGVGVGVGDGVGAYLGGWVGPWRTETSLGDEAVTGITADNGSSFVDPLLEAQVEQLLPKVTSHTYVDP